MLRLCWRPLELTNRQHDVSRWGSFELEHIGAWWKSSREVILTGAKEVQLHVLEVPNGPVVDERLVA